VRHVLSIGAAGLVILGTMLIAAEPRADEPAPPPKPTAIDASTLRHKVLCGYQGWFRCPGDPADRGWRHWSRSAKRITPNTLAFEMWPDMSELADDEKYAAPGFNHPDGKPAHLFSSAHPKTVERHFDWMRQYGIDGVVLQRFLVDLGDPSLDTVLAHVRASADKSGRVYAVCYDLTGAPKEKLLDLITADWKRLVDDRKVTEDDRYLRHAGKPVVFVWGFFSDRFGAKLANQVIDFFQADSPYAATLVGGCQWQWRREKDAEWAKVFRRFDVLSPWNVGNVAMEGGRKYAATGHWKDDLAEAKKSGKAFLPVVYPGFGWTNLKGKAAARATIPRLGGEFYWRQFVTATELGAEMVYVAMFDEVDEGTAIFKVTNSPPKEGTFATYDGLPTDWYLQLTGEGSKLIRGERKAGTGLPIKP
jgi:glycosyl hydrolase family 99